MRYVSLPGSCYTQLQVMAYVGLDNSDSFDAGNGNVSHHLQPELQNCTTVQELELVTAANCQHSADVWIASQPLALSALAALISNNQQCSMQQVLSLLGSLLCLSILATEHLL